MEMQRKQVTNKNNISGERVRECREEKHLTLEELAARVYELPENGGKSRSPGHIGYVERGERGLSTDWAWLLSIVLGVRMEYLLGKDDYKTENQLKAAKEVVPFLQEMKIREAVGAFLEKFGLTFDPPIESGFFKDDQRTGKIVEKVIKEMGITHSPSWGSIEEQDRNYSDGIDEEWLSQLDDDERTEYAEFIARAAREELIMRNNYTLLINGKQTGVVSSCDVEDFIEELSDYAMTAIERFFRNSEIEHVQTFYERGNK